MSGIAGIFEPRGSAGLATEQSARSMLAAMKHRGPDGCSISLVRGLAIGHQSLNTTSSFSGHQCLEIAGCLVTADVRLDGRIQLARDLQISADISDVELLVRAYLRWRDRCVEHLLGDFAFALFDGDQLFCARDHFGVKPFYYRFFNGCLVFGSEAMPIAVLTDARINEERIADSLVFPLEHIDKTSTCYKDVFRLPPASSIVASASGINLQRYWRPECGDEVGTDSFEDRISEFGELLETAVSDRIQGGTKAAITLSGGIDSTTIVGFASGLQQIRTFSTLAEPGVSCQETEHIEHAIREMGLEAVTIEPADMEIHFEELINQSCMIQEPFDCYMQQMMLLNILAKQNGHRYLLDGVEGDLLYSLPPSYPSYLLRHGNFRSSVTEIYHQWSRLYGKNIFLPLLFARSIRQMGIPSQLSFLRRAKKRLLGSQQQKLLADSLLSDDFILRTRSLERFEAMSGALDSARGSLKEDHVRRVDHPAIPAALERYDRVAALSGIEPRHPLMDKRLVEFSLAQPYTLNVYQGWSKYLLRRVGAGKVPNKIRWRIDKEENAWRFHERFINAKRQYLRSTVIENKQLIEGYIKQDRLLDPGDDDLMPLFGLICWLKRQGRQA